SRYPLSESWNFGGLVNLSVFNGGLTRAQVAEAKANLDNLRATEDATRNNVTLEVRQALLNLRQQAESIGVADKGLEQGRENLSLAEGRYKTGVGNIIELTDAQVALVSAEASRVQALVGYRTALTIVQVGTYVSGPIQAIDVGFNSPVKKGQRVAKIDPATFAVKVREAEASLKNTQAKVVGDRADAKLKKVLLERNRVLLARNL